MDDVWSAYLAGAKEAATAIAAVPRGSFSEQGIRSAEPLSIVDTAWEAVLRSRSGNIATAEAAERLHSALLNARSCQILAQVAADRGRAVEPRTAQQWQASLDAAGAEWKALSRWHARAVDTGSDTE